MYKKSNIIITQFPTKEGLEETLKIFNSKMQDAHAKSANLFYETMQWSPFKRRDSPWGKNGKS